MQKIVVITESLLENQLLKDGRVLQEIPFLVATKRAVDAVSGCRACQRASKRAAAEQALNSAKQGIATLPREKLDFLKQILGATTLRITWKVTEGGITRRPRVEV